MTQTANIIGSATARAPGSCGELAQGMLNGGYFLVSCPIDMYAVATVSLSRGSGQVHAPTAAPKSRRAVELTLSRFGMRDVDAHLSLSSPLLRGKGMASSTADISASIAATAAALGADMPPFEIARTALEIEPSDGVMLPGIALLDHKRGSIAKTIGSVPPMRVIVLDFGGDVDTLAFNGVDRDAALKRLQPEFGEALALIERGIRMSIAADIGAGATLSAIANQTLLHKPQLEDALRLADDVGALGVNAAHSGTVLGMLFADDAALVENAISRARAYLPDLRRIYSRRIVNGGVEVVDSRKLCTAELRYLITGG